MLEIVFDPQVHYDGKPCIRCGSTIRFIKHRSCVRCQRERWDIAKARDPEQWRKNHTIHMKRWRAKNPKREKAMRLASENRRQQKPCARIGSLACGAIRRGVAAGLVCADLAALTECLMSGDYEHCACCGKVLDYSRGKGVNKRNDSPSLDRVDPREGYTIANTKIICWRCNDLKRDMLPEEVLTFHQHLVVYVSAHAVALARSVS
jgi:hypothetical protein